MRCRECRASFEPGSGEAYVWVDHDGSWLGFCSRGCCEFYIVQREAADLDYVKRSLGVA